MTKSPRELNTCARLPNHMIVAFQAFLRARITLYCCERVIFSTAHSEALQEGRKAAAMESWEAFADETIAPDDLWSDVDFNAIVNTIGDPASLTPCMQIPAGNEAAVQQDHARTNSNAADCLVRAQVAIGEETSPSVEETG